MYIMNQAIISGLESKEALECHPLALHCMGELHIICHNCLLTCVCIHIGVYTGDSEQDDQDLFITEMHTFRDLLAGLNTPCPCGMSMHPWFIYSILKVYVQYTYTMYDMLTLILH